jgi:lysophospholipase L1-like esterase
MSTFNNGFIQSGDGNLADPIHVGRPGQQVVFSNVTPAENYLALYPTIESVPADFNGTVDIVTPTYRATVKGDGTTKYTTGNGPIADRPSAADFGVGTWHDESRVYVSDGASWSAGVNKNGNYKEILGDSLSATMWKQGSISGFITASGGIATATIASAAMLPWTKFRLARSPTAGYNKVHTVIDMPTINTVTFLAPADAPASEAFSSHLCYLESDQTTSTSYVGFLKALTKHRFYIPNNNAIGGEDSTEVLPRIDGEILQNNPDSILILLGTNDALNTADGSITNFVANMTSIYERCLAQGMEIEACTIPPFGAAYADVASVVKNRFLTNANKWIRAYVAQHEKMKLHDLYNLLTDPAQADGRALTGLSSADGIHWNIAGGYKVGKYMADNYASWYGPHPDKLPSANSSGFDFDADGTNKWSNPLFVGAGPVATGWLTTYTGTGNVKTDSTVARTLVKDGDELGQNQKTALDSTASGSGGTHLLYQDLTARMVAGKTYIARGSVIVTKGSLTTLECGINLEFTVGGVVRKVRAGLIDPPLTTAMNFVFETPAFVYPTGASAAKFYMRSLSSGTANDASLEWGRVEFELVD